MKTLKRNSSPGKVLNLEDTIILTTIDGQKVSAHPTYRFSEKEWNNIVSNDQRKFLIMKNKYIRRKKKESKKKIHEHKNLPTVITSHSTETKCYSQITEDDVVNEEIEIIEHFEKKLKPIDRDDIKFIQQLEGCIVKLDTDFLSMVSRAAPKKRAVNKFVPINESTNIKNYIDPIGQWSNYCHTEGYTEIFERKVINAILSKVKYTELTYKASYLFTMTQKVQQPHIDYIWPDLDTSDGKLYAFFSL